MISDFFLEVATPSRESVMTRDDINGSPRRLKYLAAGFPFRPFPI